MGFWSTLYQGVGGFVEDCGAKLKKETFISEGYQRSSGSFKFLPKHKAAEGPTQLKATFVLVFLSKSFVFENPTLDPDSRCQYLCSNLGLCNSPFVVARLHMTFSNLGMDHQNEIRAEPGFWKCLKTRLYASIDVLVYGRSPQFR